MYVGMSFHLYYGLAVDTVKKLTVFLMFGICTLQSKVLNIFCTFIWIWVPSCWLVFCSRQDFSQSRYATEGVLQKFDIVVKAAHV